MPRLKKTKRSEGAVKAPAWGYRKRGVRGLLKAGPKNNKGPGWILKSVIFLRSDRLKSVIAGEATFQSAKFALKRTVFALCGKAAPLSAKPAYVSTVFWHALCCLLSCYTPHGGCLRRDWDETNRAGENPAHICR